MTQFASESQETEGKSHGAEPVLIVGMHRSGTSMIAKLLQEAGLYLGPEDALMPPAEENPEGFFEHLEFVRLNDEVLNAASAGWDCPPPSDVTWEGDAFAPFRDQALALAADLDTRAPWGFKDPRTSLTLPFWRSALGPVRTVVVLRNPLEVVTSLHRRNGFSIALSLTLWRIYAERILKDTTPESRLITHYDAYFLEPGREIARVVEFARIARPHDPAALQETMVAQLRHHRKTIRDLETHGFPAAIIDLYRRMSREAEWWEGGETADPDPPSFFLSAPPADTISRGAGGVDLVRVENEALRRNNADFTVALADRQTRVAELEAALSVQEIARGELDGRIVERDSRIHERNGLIARRDLTISALQQQLAHNATEFARLREQVDDLNERLAESERAREILQIQDRDLRARLTQLHDMHYQRDAEIMGTLGAALSRHAPGAPASIYYRKLVAQVRQQVAAHVPEKSRVLVATYGDPAMLQLGNRLTEHFPRSAPGISADYTDVSDEEAIAQLSALADAGAEYLVAPGPAMPWLINHPALQRHLEAQHSVIASERGLITIYALNRQQGQVPA